jgi:4-hydroxy-4-methyl-2-oxoglutarate aldolase
MNRVIVTDPPRADLADVDTLAQFGVATVHEALGRSCYLGPGLRPIQDGARTGGTAVTVRCWPGDNLMIHAAVEQCRPGDLLVVTTTSPCTDGLFGELFATALAHRGVRGLVTTSEGQLGLDRYGLRATLADLGVEYVNADEHSERQQ